MMADSVEHVISYRVMFEKFHSPALGGFAVISHWLPFLFFSGYSGALADRFDHAPAQIRGRVIGLYSMASLGLRAFAGVTVGLLGTMIGIHWSLALSALALFAITAGLLSFITRTTS